MLWLRTSFFLSLVLSASSSCDLDCKQNAPCVDGDADFSDHPKQVDGTTFDFHETRSVNGQHCACPHGYTGVLCDTPYDTCDGDHPCYNGGVCIPGLYDALGNEQLFCDCAKAIKDGVTYVGKYCEHTAEQYCNEEESLFCTNGGRCNVNYPQMGGPCICPDGFEGLNCQYRTGQVPECSLTCENGGQCTFDSPSAAEQAQQYPYWGQSNDHPLNMRCVCPDEWDGVFCEIPKEKCGESHCFNGGTCLTRVVDDRTIYHCDCTSTYTDNMAYAGRFCQYPATSFCGSEEGLNGHLFCVNGGKCKTNAYQGCDCTPPFSGFSCEFVDEDDLSGSGQQGDEDVGEPLYQPGIDLDDVGEPLYEPGDDPNSDVDVGQPIYEAGPSNADHDMIEPIYDETPQWESGFGGGTTGGSGGGSDVDIGEPIYEAGDGLTNGMYYPDTDDYVDNDIGRPLYDPLGDMTCDLVCQNDGVCRIGMKDLGYLEGLAENAPHLNETHDNFQHCVCPWGYYGVYCEHEANPCGEGTHYCLHGSQCIPEGDGHACDCTTAATENATYAGDSCEHPVNDICTKDVERYDAAPLSFCVNGGTCKARVTVEEPHPGCYCVEGFEGPHCELRAGTMASRPQNSGTSPGGKGIQVFAIVISIIAIMAVAVFSAAMYVRNRRRKQKAVNNALRWGSSYRDEPDDSVNLAPRRQSSYLDPYPVNNHSSSTDPMASHLAPKSPAASNEMDSIIRAAIEEDDSEDFEDAPQVYIGPPRDEDGHELHNVEII